MEPVWQELAESATQENLLSRFADRLRRETAREFGEAREEASQGFAEAPWVDVADPRPWRKLQGIVGAGKAGLGALGMAFAPLKGGGQAMAQTPVEEQWGPTAEKAGVAAGLLPDIATLGKLPLMAARKGGPLLSKALRGLRTSKVPQVTGTKVFKPSVGEAETALSQHMAPAETSLSQLELSGEGATIPSKQASKFIDTAVGGLSEAPLSVQEILRRSPTQITVAPTDPQKLALQAASGGPSEVASYKPLWRHMELGPTARRESMVHEGLHGAEDIALSPELGMHGAQGAMSKPLLKTPQGRQLAKGLSESGYSEDAAPAELIPWLYSYLADAVKNPKLVALIESVLQTPKSRQAALEGTELLHRPAGRLSRTTPTGISSQRVRMKETVPHQ